MKNLFRLTFLFAMLLSISACAGGGASSSDGPAVAVLEALESAWNAQDLDAAMALFAEDAVETNGLGTFTGKDAIRGLYEAGMDEFSLDCKNYKVDDNTVTYECFLKPYSGTWTSTEYHVSVVENGEIKSNVLTDKK